MDDDSDKMDLCVLLHRLNAAAGQFDEDTEHTPEPEPAPTAAQKAQLVLSLQWRYDPDGGAAAT
jgi:hypothetical protein